MADRTAAAPGLAREFLDRSLQGFATSTVATLAKGVRTRVFGDNLPGAVVGLSEALFGGAVPALRNQIVATRILVEGNSARIKVGVPTPAFVGFAKRLGSHLFKGPHAKVMAAAFCSALCARARLPQLQERFEHVFEAALSQEIAAARAEMGTGTARAPKTTPTQAFEATITPEIVQLAEQTFRMMTGKDTPVIAGAVAEDVNWHSMARRFPEEPWPAGVRPDLAGDLGRKLRWSITSTAAFMVALLRLGKQNGLATLVRQTAISEMPDSYKEIVKMATLRDTLVKLAHENPTLRADLLPLIKQAAVVPTTLIDRDFKLALAYSDAWSKPMIAQYGTGARDLDYKSPASFTPAEFGALFTAICPGYNAFRPGTAARFLAKYPGIKIYPAREGSVCIYIDGPEAILRSVATVNGKLPLTEEHLPYPLVTKHPTKADEIGFENNGRLRIWWD